MLTAEARSRLAVVLVGARNPQNIGAAARAMQDFGFTQLRVVNEFAPPFEAAQLEASSAVAADHVMRSARRYTSLAEAIADCNLVVGTTAIGGRGPTRTVLALKDAALEILSALEAPYAVTPDPSGTAPHPDIGSADLADDPPGCRVALLFGSEKTGLTNEQLSFCSTLLTIPMYAPEGRHLSMNLGQSVAVCLYELTRSGFEGSRELRSGYAPPATSADRQRLLELVLETMERSDYARRFPANARPEVVRHLVAGLGATKDEAATWMGLFRLILRALTKKTDGL